MAKMQRPKQRPKRNGALFDRWSVIHLMTGVLAGWIIDPFVALAVMVLYEPFEVLLLSPWLWTKYGMVFGHESINNSLSDIFFDTLGVALGYWLLTALAGPPFHLF